MELKDTRKFDGDYPTRSIDQILVFECGEPMGSSLVGEKSNLIDLTVRIELDG